MDRVAIIVIILLIALILALLFGLPPFAGPQ
jgi:hypothetical protein